MSFYVPYGSTMLTFLKVHSTKILSLWQHFSKRNKWKSKFFLKVKSDIYFQAGANEGHISTQSWWFTRPGTRLPWWPRWNVLTFTFFPPKKSYTYIDQKSAKLYIQKSHFELSTLEKNYYEFRVFPRKSIMKKTKFSIIIIDELLWMRNFIRISIKF